MNTFQRMRPQRRLRERVADCQLELPPNPSHYFPIPSMFYDELATYAEIYSKPDRSPYRQLHCDPREPNAAADEHAGRLQHAAAGVHPVVRSTRLRRRHRRHGVEDRAVHKHCVLERPLRGFNSHLGRHCCHCHANGRCLTLYRVMYLVPKSKCKTRHRMETEVEHYIEKRKI